MIRPYVTLYGEGLPDDAVNSAVKAIRNADMLIIAGTSLKVYPAASFVYEFRGKHMVVINREKLNLQLDEEDDLIICDSMGKIFEEVNKRILSQEEMT